MRDLTGKIAWITGGGGGIGEAGAISLAAAGCAVMLSGRRSAAVEAVAARIRDEGGVAAAFPLDVTDENAVSRTAAAIAADHGPVDVLVNSAGVNVPARHWPDISASDWKDIVSINLNGAFHCIQAVLPAMRRRGEGQIINVSSWAGARVSFLTGPAYTAAKHGLNALTENLNMEECVNGVRATALCPGEVSTAIMDRRPAPISPEIRARMLQPEDLGEAIRYIAETPAHMCVNEMIVSPTWNRGYARFHQTEGPE